MGVELTTLEIEARLKGVEQAIAGLDGLKTHGKGAEDSFASLALKIAGFTSLANLAVSGGQKLVRMFVEAGKESIVLAAGFEKARITWGVLVGDMDKGSAVFEQIRDFAAKTPLSFEGLNQAATTVKGFGVATEDLIPTLSKLGDIAMGDNAKLQSMALVYGQVMAQGKAKTQDLYQFINAGVPIFNLLSQSMNVSAGAIKDLAAEGAITFEEIDKAIVKATSAGGQFFGMMDKTAETTSGKWSTALDNFKASLADLGENVIPMINKALDAYNEAQGRKAAVNNIQDVLAGNGDLESAISTLQEIIKLQQTDPSTFFWKYVGEEVSATGAIISKKATGVGTYIALLEKMQQEKERLYRGGFASSGDSKGDIRAAALMPDKGWDDGWERIFKDTTGIETGAGKSAEAVQKYVDKLIAAEQWTREFGGTTESINKEVQNELKTTADTLLASGKFKEGETTIVALGEAFEKLATSIPDEGSYSGILAEYKEPVSTVVKPVSFDEYSRMNDEIKLLMATEEDFQRIEDEVYISQQRRLGATEEEIVILMKLRGIKRDLTEDEEAADAVTLANKKSLDEYSASIQAIDSYMKSMGMETFISGFQSIGAAMVSGANAGDSLAESMSNIGMQILNSMPQLLFQAGVMAMATPGGFWLGAGLIAASGLVALGSGIANETQAQAEATPNALGGVYSSRSLHSYVNGVYDSPQHFAFKNGGAFGWEGSQAFARGGVFGEAGAEGIMPLRRNSAGRLGVDASGSSVSVQVVNNLGVQSDATVTETTGSDGSRQIQVTLEKMVMSTIASGKADGAMASRYGAFPRAQRRV